MGAEVEVWLGPGLGGGGRYLRWLLGSTSTPGCKAGRAGRGSRGGRGGRGRRWCKGRQGRQVVQGRQGGARLAAARTRAEGARDEAWHEGIATQHRVAVRVLE